ncbi:MAG TPA: DUF1934 domain-containing protein [Clostridia bacterium]|nr:DUF1934 domain-containing protein [Clostridia bacterium]
MHKEVLVTVKGTQNYDMGDRETIELVTVGRLFFKNESYYIMYDETEISGMEGTTTLLKAENAKSDKVTLNRAGTSEFRQVFEEGVHDEGNYVTPFGCMSTRVLPWKVKVDLTEVGGNINLEYELELSRQKIGYNELSITVKEV